MVSLLQLKQKETRVTCKEANEQKRETRKREKKRRSQTSTQSLVHIIFFTTEKRAFEPWSSPRWARALVFFVGLNEATRAFNGTKRTLFYFFFSLLPPFLLSFSSFPYFFFSGSFFYPAFLFSSYSFLFPSFFYVFNSVVRDRVHLVRCWRRNARTDAVCTVFYGRSSARMPLGNLRFVFLEFYEIVQHRK